MTQNQQDSQKTFFNKPSQKTKLQNEAAHAQVIKLINSVPNFNRNDYHYRLKMLEFNNFKNLKMLKKGLKAVGNIMKNRLKNSSLNNKQKAEILLVAETEAFRIVDGLIKSVEEVDS